MNTHITFPKQLCIGAAVCILLMFSAGYHPKYGDADYGVQMSAGSAESAHLNHILLGRNKNSIVKDAEADYRKRNYYIFWTGAPCEIKFNSYLTAYAKQKYNLVLVNCGCKNRVGAYYYNSKMESFFLEEKRKSLAVIYLEAKIMYNKALAVYLR
jgi:hypothetical protein